MSHQAIAAADAVKAFKGQRISVQEARPVKVKGEDGVMRDAFKTEDVALAAEHVLSAKLYEDGRLTITTIDGRRYEVKGYSAPKSAEAPAQ